METLKESRTVATAGRTAAAQTFRACAVSTFLSGSAVTPFADHEEDRVDFLGKTPAEVEARNVGWRVQWRRCSSSLHSFTTKLQTDDAVGPSADHEEDRVDFLGKSPAEVEAVKEARNAERREKWRRWVAAFPDDAAQLSRDAEWPMEEIPDRSASVPV